ncbi:MAG: hypothetical protein L5656_02180 [Thermanaeromonas sp.]|uniref:hypothetical protein n=1 Tax=Thermanaeromonas sp. TaxID=2003697 RepID=UPI00243BA63B|nr:hypothetical protein [Thermanaeromonas sp.]MCG0277331.1 hypothetical protein [Thermanaeromonas sp.]
MEPQDLDFLVRAVVDKRDDHEKVKEIIRDKEDFIEIMLEDPKLFRKLWEKQEELIFISPYFLFNILLRQVRRDLKNITYMYEGHGHMRLPVFDAPKVKKILDDDSVLSYLADLLSSFTRTQTYTLIYRLGPKLYRRALSSIDLDDLIFLAGIVDERYKFELNRRVGDLALFIAGMFPEYIKETGRPVPWSKKIPRSLENYLEVGRYYYTLASEHPYASEWGLRDVLSVLAENVSSVQKALNWLSEKYIGPKRSLWFNTF